MDPDIPVLEKYQGKTEADDPEIIRLINANNISEVETNLLNGKSKVDETDNGGMTGLQHAAYKGQYEMCKLLLEYGADVNADFHDFHYSALTFAAISGNAEIVKLFLDSGAKTHHTNTLKRTAAQMSGFVGNHEVVSLINNYLPMSTVEYYTNLQGLETEPKLPLEAAKPLYNLIMQTNLNPIYIAMSVGNDPILMKNLAKASKTLELMCEKEAKQGENVNEILCMKFHFLSYVFKTLEKEYNKRKDRGEEEYTGSPTKDRDRLVFEILIKKWLRGRLSDGFEEHLEYYVRDAIKAFPYVEMPLFLQIVRNVASKHPGTAWAVDLLQSSINGMKFYADHGDRCSTCGHESKNLRKCSNCRCVQYCNQLCQRLQWSAHKKFCEQYKVEIADKTRLEKRDQYDLKEELHAMIRRGEI